MTGSARYAVRGDSFGADIYGALCQDVFGSSRIWLAIVAAQCLAFLAGFGLGLTLLQLALIVLVPWPLLQAVVVLRGRSLWPAQETLIELDVVRPDGRSVDGSGVPAVSATPADTQSQRELHLGFDTALAALARGDDGIGPLAAARASAGPMPRAYARSVLLARYRHVIASVVVGVWLLAALLVGMATAGGVVWF